MVYVGECIVDTCLETRTQIFRFLLWIFQIVHNFPVIHYMSG